MHFPALSTEAPVSSVSMVLAWVSNTQCRLEFSAPESLARDVVIRSPWRMTMWRSLLARALFCDEAMRAVCQSHCPQIGGARPLGTAASPRITAGSVLDAEHGERSFDLAGCLVVDAAGRTGKGSALPLPVVR